MIFNLSEQDNIGNKFIAELRDVRIQTDRMRFRKNLERVAEILGYEVSKTLAYESYEVETPLGISTGKKPAKKIVLATILRAGLPMHQGLLNIFDDAGNAFIGAYRKHHKDGTFEINREYTSCPDLNDSILIISDPMLATGASLDLGIKSLLDSGKPAEMHIITAIASTPGVQYIRRLYPKTKIWLGAVDEELTAKSYIVPGLGDAGDLAYGGKLQE